MPSRLARAGYKYWVWLKPCPTRRALLWIYPMQNRLTVAERLLLALAAIITILAGLHDLGLWPF